MATDELRVERRQFVAALAAVFVSRRLAWPEARSAVTIRTLAEYQAEGAAYTSALNALGVRPTSMAAHTALSQRVGSDLTKRIARTVAEAAQDARVIASIKSLLASSTAFSAFARAVAADSKAVLNLPGLRAAIDDAMAREAALRRITFSAQAAFTALIRQNAANLVDASRRAELDAVEYKFMQPVDVDQITGALLAALALTIVAAALLAAPTSVALGGAAMDAVRDFVQGAAWTADGTRNTLQECLDAADARRRACRRSITTPLPSQRAAEEALCEGRYLADVFSCNH